MAMMTLASSSHAARTFERHVTAMALFCKSIDRHGRYSYVEVIMEAALPQV